MNREEMYKNLDDPRPFDVIIIGGGATGLGAAVDAASRGYRTLLLEQSDFAKGTSSRSTKLIHGGLRYLQQGNIALVTEALKERGLLCQNAPHLVHPLPFLVPTYKWWEGPFYGVGLKIYDLLAGELGIEPSRHLSKEETLNALPTLDPEDLRGAIQYYDGQFDDARLAITLARTAATLGATLLNYVHVEKLLKKKGLLHGVLASDVLTGQKIEVHGKAIINATGVYCDTIRKLDQKGVKGIIAPSQGVHLVLPRKFLPTESALMVPHTEDNRVLFFVPWHGTVLLGTTDTAVKECPLEPQPEEKEIDFLLKHAARYLVDMPRRKDLLSMFAGLRPLVKLSGNKSTSVISRDHTILLSSSGLITIAGGKWTTYRKMAEDVINKAIIVAGLEERACSTMHLQLHGWLPSSANKQGCDPSYGSDNHAIELLIRTSRSLGKPLHPNLPYLRAHVVWAARHEMALCLEDVLSRRLRALLLDAKAAIECAPLAAELMAKELKETTKWETAQVKEFKKIAANYLPR